MRSIWLIALISNIVFSAELSFSPLPLAQGDEELIQTRVSDSARIDGKQYMLSYKELLLTSMQLKGSPLPFGTLVDRNLQPLKRSNGSLKISTAVDSNSILHAGGKDYLITHLESSPGVLYMTELGVEGDRIIPISTSPLDFSSVEGTLINCAGSKTAWNTHLGGEEDYSLNSRYADKDSVFYIGCEEKEKVFSGNNADGERDHFCSYVAHMQEYLQDYTIESSQGYNGKRFSPYNYGYIIEAGVDEKGRSRVAKHYVTGKYTPELAIAMPDGKTFYMSDDGNGKGLYKFVSDIEIGQFVKDWSGSLYMAKAEQTSGNDGGSYKISWIPLGHSSDEIIKSLIQKGLKISDIFDIKAAKQKRCEQGYRYIFEDASGYCLRLKDAKESGVFKDNKELKTAAGFLESRKYGAYLGATSEFVKEEGITYDKDKNVIYLAMSSIKETMLDDYQGAEGNNDIRVEKNICGAVYELALDEDFSVTQMKTLVSGKVLDVNDSYAQVYQCSPEHISNPDNILYIGDNTLLIGEDTTSHLTNMLWAYNTQKKISTRIATLPIGAEVTGLFKAEIGGKPVIFFNLQHPFEDIPVNAWGENVKEELLDEIPYAHRNGRIGYIDFTKIK